MKTGKTPAVVVLATVVTIGVGMPEDAMAYAYGYSYLNVSGLSITPSPSLVVANGSASAGSVGSECFGLVSSGCDIAVVSGPPGVFDDEWVSLEGSSVNFARGDGLVPARSQFPIELHTLAEAQSLTTSSLQAYSGYQLSLLFDATADIAFAISFNASSTQVAKLTDAGLGDFARSEVVFQILIKNDITGAEVFRWIPNGNIYSGIEGGIETIDPFDLSDSYAVSNSNGTSGRQQAGDFAAVTNILPTGRYVLTIYQEVTAYSSFDSVPEPATLALFGLGLAGIGVMRRKKLAA